MKTRNQFRIGYFHFFITILSLAMIPTAWAVELHVPSEYGTIQAAVDAAEDYDEIIVADGTYTGDGNRDIYLYNQGPMTIRSENGLTNCIIDCEGSEADNHRGFHIYQGGDPNLIIDGFTIINGYRSSGGSASTGGGIYSEVATVTVRNCILQDNHAVNGGGIIINGGYGSISNCVIRNNEGMGLYIHVGSATVTDCVISDNSGGFGGGLSCAGSEEVEIRNCIFQGNTANYDGGGMRFYDSISVSIQNCDVQGNASGRDGGGIKFDSSISVDLANCLVTGNSAPWSGGGLNLKGVSSFNIHNCTISENRAVP